jgi:hypothetical protein
MEPLPRRVAVFSPKSAISPSAAGQADAGYDWPACSNASVEQITATCLRVVIFQHYHVQMQSTEEVATRVE